MLVMEWKPFPVQRSHCGAVGGEWAFHATYAKRKTKSTAGARLRREAMIGQRGDRDTNNGKSGRRGRPEYTHARDKHHLRLEILELGIHREVKGESTALGWEGATEHASTKGTTTSSSGERPSSRTSAVAIQLNLNSGFIHLDPVSRPPHRRGSQTRTFRNWYI